MRRIRAEKLLKKITVNMNLALEMEDTRYSAHVTRLQQCNEQDLA